MDAIHPDVLPFDGERAGVPDIVQGDHDVLELNVSVPERTEIPVARGVAETDVSAENANRSVAVSPPDILHVRMKNARAEHADKFDVVDSLVTEMRGIVVESKSPVTLHGCDRTLGTRDVERDFRGV